MTANSTRVLNQLLALTDDLDDIAFEERGGHAFIVLGSTQIAASLSSQAALDKLATVAAEAAAANRAHTLRKVA